MPDHQDQPEKDPGLTKKFKEFSFGDTPEAPVVEVGKKAPPPPPVSSDPPKLTKEDMDFVPYRGPDAMPTGGRQIPIRDLDEEDRIAREEAEAWEQHDHEMHQDAVFEAAGSMFRHNREVTNVLTMISNLEMQSIVAAGLLDEHYADLPARRRNDLMIAALALNAANFEEIADDLPQDSVGIVYELLELQMEPDDDVRRMMAESLEPDSKRVLLAMTIADLEMSLMEMKDGEPGLEKDEQEAVGEFIKALAPGVDRGLRQHAISAFNDVGRMSHNDLSLKEKPDGSVVMSTQPEILVDFEKTAPKKAKPGNKKKAPPKNQPRK